MTTRRSFVAICLAFLLALTGQSMAAVRAANDATGQMVLCIGTTAVTVYIDETGAPTEAPHFCPKCIVSLMTAVVPEAFETPIKLTIVEGIAMEVIAAQSRVEPFGYLSRAPPVLI